MPHNTKPRCNEAYQFQEKTRIILRGGGSSGWRTASLDWENGRNDFWISDAAPAPQRGFSWNWFPTPLLRGSTSPSYRWKWQDAPIPGLMLNSFHWTATRQTEMSMWPSVMVS